MSAIQDFIDKRNNEVARKVHMQKALGLAEMSRPEMAFWIVVNIIGFSAVMWLIAG